MCEDLFSVNKKTDRYDSFWHALIGHALMGHPLMCNLNILFGVQIKVEDQGLSIVHVSVAQQK